MAPADPLTALAEAVADGQTPDWDAAERRASTSDERAAVAALRDLAVVGGLFASGTAGMHAPWRDRTPLEPGTMWGSLRIDAHVGRGRFGDVYRAWDPALHRVVALKLVASDDPDRQADSAVIEEGRLMARIRHPNVVAIHGAQRISDVIGLSMEFIEGRTLEDELLERGSFSAPELTNVADALCGALAAVHGAGLVHRDVKATNVIREAGGRLVLGDFGTGLAADAVPNLRVGLVGTPVYIAPEIFQRGAATEKSDLYSLGVLLFHLATGRFPVSGRSMLELRAAHEGAGRSSLGTLRADLPLGLRTAIDGLLDPDPERRLASAEIARRMFVLPTRARRRWPAVAALTAVVITGTAGWAWWTSTRERGGSVPVSQQPAAQVAADPPPAPPVTSGALPTPPPAESTGKSIGEPPGGSSVVLPAVVTLRPELQATMGMSGVVVNKQLVACASPITVDVSLCNLVTGEVRVLMPMRSPMVPLFGRHTRLLSPDGMRIAARVNEGPPNQRQALLYLVGTDGQAPVVRLRTSADVGLYVHRWLADSSALLVSEGAGDGRQVYILPADGIARKELVRLVREHGVMLDLSPDGRFLAVTRDQGRGNRSLAVIDLRTQLETTLVSSLAGLEFPLWTPDGRAIVFTILRGSSSQLMRLPMSDGAATGMVELVLRFARTVARLTGFTADGSLISNTRSAVRTAHVASIDVTRSHLAPAQLVDPGDAEDTVGADWSPDGKRVAYLRGLLGGFGGPPGTLVIREASGPVVSEFSLPSWMPETAAQVRWSPDGQRLAVAYGGETANALTIDVIDLATRERTNVVSGVRFESPRWDPSGEWLYYREAATIVRHNVSTGDRQTVYRSQGGRIQSDAGFDVSRTDGALVIPVIPVDRPQRCAIRIVEPTGSIIDRHTFDLPCRAVAWNRVGTRILVSSEPGSRKSPSMLWSLERAAGAPVALRNETHVIHDLSLGPPEASGASRLLFSAGNPPWNVVMVTGVQTSRR